MSSKFLNLDTDDTLGGASSSDEKIASQKAIKDYVDGSLSNKQDTLVSGENIKTLGGVSLVGSGNIDVSTSGIISTDGITVNYNDDDALQAHAVINPRTEEALTIWQGTEAQWESGETATWYNWKTNATLTAASENIPENTYLTITKYSGRIVEGNGILVAPNPSTSGESAPIAYYSTDGINWTPSTTLAKDCSSHVAFGNGKFVLISTYNNYNDNKGYYSTDGDNWTSFDLPSTTMAQNDDSNQSFIFANNKFIYVHYQTLYYTEDLINWTTVNFTTDDSFRHIVYFKNKYILIGEAPRKNNLAISSDLQNWTKTKVLYMSSWDYISSIAVNEDRIVLACYGQYSAKGFYSTDALEWVDLTFPTNFTSTRRYVIYKDGSFIFAYNGSNIAYYSSDAITWNQLTLPSNTSSNPTFYIKGNKVFLVSYTFSGNDFSITTSFNSCYTTDSEPTTTSTVYSAPSTISALTVSSVTSGAITLSDNNTYYYNATGNQTTSQTIGDAHPTWLCNINNVGVKVGNVTVATNAQSVSVSYDTETKTLTIS